MRRAHPYTAWEDYQAGMFGQSDRCAEETALAGELLGDPEEFRRAAREMVGSWPIAAEHNLSALDTNRRAWIGAAACFWLHGCREHTVRSAWWVLPRFDQWRANRVADQVIVEWEEARADAQTLFG